MSRGGGGGGGVESTIEDGLDDDADADATSSPFTMTSRDITDVSSQLNFSEAEIQVLRKLALGLTTPEAHDNLLLPAPSPSAATAAVLPLYSSSREPLVPGKPTLPSLSPVVSPTPRLARGEGDDDEGELQGQKNRFSSSYPHTPHPVLVPSPQGNGHLTDPLAVRQPSPPARKNTSPTPTPKGVEGSGPQVLSEIFSPSTYTDPGQMPSASSLLHKKGSRLFSYSTEGLGEGGSLLLSDVDDHEDVGQRTSKSLTTSPLAKGPKAAMDNVSPGRRRFSDRLKTAVSLSTSPVKMTQGTQVSPGQAPSSAAMMSHHSSLAGPIVTQSVDLTSQPVVRRELNMNTFGGGGRGNSGGIGAAAAADEVDDLIVSESIYLHPGLTEVFLRQGGLHSPGGSPLKENPSSGGGGEDHSRPFAPSADPQMGGSYDAFRSLAGFSIPSLSHDGTGYRGPGGLPRGSDQVQLQLQLQLRHLEAELAVALDGRRTVEEELTRLKGTHMEVLHSLEKTQHQLEEMTGLSKTMQHAFGKKEEQMRAQLEEVVGSLNAANGRESSLRAHSVELTQHVRGLEGAVADMSQALRQKDVDMTGMHQQWGLTLTEVEKLTNRCRSLQEELGSEKQAQHRIIQHDKMQESALAQVRQENAAMRAFIEKQDEQLTTTRERLKEVIAQGNELLQSRERLGREREAGAQERAMLTAKVAALETDHERLSSILRTTKEDMRTLELKYRALMQQYKLNVTAMHQGGVAGGATDPLGASLPPRSGGAGGADMQLLASALRQIALNSEPGAVPEQKQLADLDPNTLRSSVKSVLEELKWAAPTSSDAAAVKLPDVAAPTAKNTAPPVPPVIQPTAAVAVSPPAPTPAVAPPLGVAPFIPSTGFSGPKPGYVFKTGNQGRGYYLSQVSPAPGGPATAVPAAGPKEEVGVGGGELLPQYQQWANRRMGPSGKMPPPPEVLRPGLSRPETQETRPSEPEHPPREAPQPPQPPSPPEPPLPASSVVGMSGNWKGLMEQTQEVEHRLLKLNAEKDSLEAEYNKMPPQLKTMVQRRRKAQVEERIEEVTKQISSCRLQLKRLGVR